MAAENAQAVAQEVIREVGKGRKPRKTEIALKHGYSPESARSGKATKTKAYKTEIASFLQKLERERDRIIAALSEKELDKVRYKDLMDSLDKLVKNHQLLSGRPTDNVAGLFIHLAPEKKEQANRAIHSFLNGEDHPTDPE